MGRFLYEKQSAIAMFPAWLACLTNELGIKEHSAPYGHEKQEVRVHTRTLTTNFRSVQREKTREIRTDQLGFL